TYPYSIGRLRKDSPDTSFPRRPSDALLATYNVFPVARTDRPEHDPFTQDVVEQTPEKLDGMWAQVWTVVAVDPEEVARRLEEAREQVRHQRVEAYRTEADPLFFKAERGKGTKAEWENKVEEIRARYPYPEADV
ncbi:hypothetical protein V6O07_05465, partial [Arthrospira platensis SPKY2]